MDPAAAGFRTIIDIPSLLLSSSRARGKMPQRHDRLVHRVSAGATIIALLRSIRPRNSVHVPDGIFNPPTFPRASVSHGSVLTVLYHMARPFRFRSSSSQALQPRSRSDTTARRRSSSTARRRPPTTRFIHRRVPQRLLLRAGPGFASLLI